jgi:hypothetical protein
MELRLVVIGYRMPSQRFLSNGDVVKASKNMLCSRGGKRGRENLER